MAKTNWSDGQTVDADDLNDLGDELNDNDAKDAVQDADIDDLQAAVAGGIGGLSEVVGDTSPQLGGDLDLNSHKVGDADAADLTKLHGVSASATQLNRVDATSSIQTQIDGKQASLGFTAENTANKGAVNGYAGLDSSGLVPAAQLPSYVDDVLEFANLAGFPGTGATGKIYVALDTNKTYRWSGSAYVEISPSPGSTDSVTEGSTNLYFTNARVTLQIPAAINAATAKATPVDADLFGIVDSAASNALKKLSWANVKATLKTYFDTIYQPLNSNLTAFAAKTAPTGAVVGTTDAQTQTNKRITRRVTAVTSSATPTFDTDASDQCNMLTLAANITSATFSGTPTDAQPLSIVFKSASAQTIALGSSVVAGPAPVPTVTVAGKYHELLLKYNLTASKWVVMAWDATGY